jgi:hypothetical protein
VAQVRARSGHVGFVVDKVALGQVFSEHLGFPCQSSFQQICHPHNHPGRVQYARWWATCSADPVGFHYEGVNIVLNLGISIKLSLHEKFGSLGLCYIFYSLTMGTLACEISHFYEGILIYARLRVMKGMIVLFCLILDKLLPRISFRQLF